MKKTTFIKIIVISILLLGFNLHFPLLAVENDEWNYFDLFEKFQEKKKWQIVGSPLVLKGKDLININLEFVEYLMEFDVKDGFQWQVISKKDSMPVTITILQLPSQSSWKQNYLLVWEIFINHGNVGHCPGKRKTA